MPPVDEASRTPGWYRDGAGERWWDGSEWTDRRRSWNGKGWVEQHGGSQPDAPVVSSHDATRGKSLVKGVLKWVAAGFVFLIVLGAILGGGAADESKTADDSAGSPPIGSGGAGASAGASARKGCVNRATDDCTPKVSSDRAVRVDAL